MKLLASLSPAGAEVEAGVVAKADQYICSIDRIEVGHVNRTGWNKELLRKTVSSRHRKIIMPLWPYG